ncbi:MAG: laccase domain-containing protein [Desulfobacterales bacterium]
MILHHENGLHFSFSLFEAYPPIGMLFLRAAAGESTGDFESLNARLLMGDDDTSVQKNRQRILPGVWERTNFALPGKVHQTRIMVLSKPPSYLCRLSAGSAAPESADVMITDIYGKFLAIQVADCQSVLLYDPQKQVVANIHSGWRGSVENIISVTVRAMQSEFGCQPGHILAGIAPSLGPCCAEFIHYTRGNSELFMAIQMPGQ